MRFVFFYPSRILGGAELLLARVAAHMRHIGHDVAVVDAPGGKLAELAEQEGIAVMLAERGCPATIRDAVVIAPSSHIAEVRHWITGDESVRHIFWAIHPYNNLLVPPFFSGFFYAHPKLLYLINRLLLNKEFTECRSAIAWLMQRRSMVFMDDECYRQTRRWYGLPSALKPVYLPIPLQVFFSELPIYRQSSGPLGIVWVGRLVDFKVHPLIYFARRLAASSARASVKLIVVGGGDQEEYVRKALSALDFHYEMQGEKDPDSLRELLLTQADIVVAMGTSALEGARLAIPTILVDASFRAINFDYRYRWLYQNHGFCLGRILDQGSNAAEGMDVDTLIAAVRDSGPKIAQACWQYFTENHEMAPIVGRLEVLASEAADVRAFTQCYEFRDGPFKAALKRLVGKRGRA